MKLALSAAASTLALLCAGLVGVAHAQATSAPVDLLHKPVAHAEHAHPTAIGDVAAPTAGDHPFYQRLTKLPAKPKPKVAQAAPPPEMPVYPLSALKGGDDAAPPIAAVSAIPLMPPAPAARHAKSQRGPQPAPAAADSWVALQGDTLRQTLRRWCQEAGWELAWNTNDDYPLEASAEFHGDFLRATTNLIGAFGHAQPAVFGAFHTANHVLVITTAPDAPAD